MVICCAILRADRACLASVKLAHIGKIKIGPMHEDVMTIVATKINGAAGTEKDAVYLNH